MRSTWFMRVLRAGVALAALAVLGTQASADVARDAKRRGFNLRAGPFAVMEVNRVLCGLDTQGNVCTAPAGSPILGGGVWPRGTPDQYIFNSGLQIAGVVPTNAGFEWAGDTTGAFFMDPRGDQGSGAAITQLFSSLDPGDNASWPAEGIVRDTSLFNDVLIGRNAVSQQDTWVRYWDGDPGFFGTGRAHPMGILVEQRGMAWNFPTGNEDIIYFSYTFWNITASDPAAYANIEPSIQGAIAALGAQFQQNVQDRLGVNIPAGGYAFDNLFAAFFMDPDVGDATNNYSTAILPFQLGLAYVSDFDQESFAFPPDVFGAPFASAPGFVGVKYLRSPIDPVTEEEVGLSLFSNTLNQATGFPDPVGVIQMWRYLSGNVNTAAGDNPCTFPNPIQRRLCFLFQDPTDTRFYQSSGPFSLEPGQSATIVVAYVHAAPVAAALTAAGGIGADVQPEIAFSGDSLAADPGKVRDIERIAGWVSAADTNMSGAIDQFEVVSVPRSLLDKAIVAQAVFDNKFLLPFAPDAPGFFLVPGNNAVTIVWQQSTTETLGDPFFEVASNPASPLFDANFRQRDVEGYRVYRGRTPAQLELIAQFDYAGTTFEDFTGGFDYGSQCAPELMITAGCPVDFTMGASNSIAVTDTLIQVPPGGRVELATGDVLILQADTAVIGGGTGLPRPTDTGLPFAFVDRGVRNSFTYHYAVTAFDVNSVASGPTSLESARITRSVTPRAPSGQIVAGELSQVALLAGDGSELDANAPLPTIDPATGIFSGPMPPTDGISLGLAAFVPDLVRDGAVTLTIDSVVPGRANDLTGQAGGPRVSATYYVTGQGAGDPVPLTFPLLFSPFGEDAHNTVAFEATPLDPEQAQRFGGSDEFSLFGEAAADAPGTYRTVSYGRGDINGDPANSAESGPRWWSGDPNENTNEPNALQCAPAAGGCIMADLTRNAGQLPGVTTLFHVQGYSTVPSVPQRNLEGITSNVARAADFEVVWGANGAVTSVTDLTHQVDVPFHEGIRASWGILTVGSFAGTAEGTTPDGDNALLTWTDIYCVAPVPQLLNGIGTALGDCGGNAQTPAELVNTASLDPVAATSSNFADAGALVATGTGFIFYLNGHFFLMQMGQLPASGTVWRARFFAGSITGTAAGDDYAFVSSIRPPAVPGLRIQVSFSGSSFDPNVTAEDLLANVHTVPDPYYVTNALEQTANTKILRFVNLPARAIVRIYSLSGVLVNVLEHNDVTGGSELTWNLRNRNNQFVASGVYFYHVETPDGREKVARFTVVNFAQ